MFYTLMPSGTLKRRRPPPDTNRRRVRDRFLKKRGKRRAISLPKNPPKSGLMGEFKGLMVLKAIIAKMKVPKPLEDRIIAEMVVRLWG